MLPAGLLVRGCNVSGGEGITKAELFSAYGLLVGNPGSHNAPIYWSALLAPSEYGKAR
jgi:hypothetical protein